MITSQRFALSVLRMNPRRCAHQVYSSGRPSSLATSVARRFSKPSPRSFEKGRLFGSAQTRSAPGPLPAFAVGFGVAGCGTRPTYETSAAAASGTPVGRVPRSGPAAVSTITATTASTSRLRKAEDIQHPAFRRRLFQISHRRAPAESRRRVPGVQVVDDDRAGPSADSRQHRDVLLAVGPAIADWLSDDSGCSLELPEQLACSCMDRFEPALHRPVEDD